MRKATVTLPADLYDELEQAARGQGITPLELLRQFFKLGFLALELESRGGSLAVHEAGFYTPFSLRGQ